MNNRPPPETAPTPSDLPDPAAAAVRFAAWTLIWHAGEAVSSQPDEGLPGLSERLHAANFAIWHYEDRVRRTDLPDAEFVGLKRAIDRENQTRNDLVGEIDQHVRRRLGAGGRLPLDDAPLHTESPGMILDRLSILVLKDYHLDEEIRRRNKDDPTCDDLKHRLVAARQQKDGLIAAARHFFAELTAGRRRYLSSRPLKLYNDPATNPELYRK